MQNAHDLDALRRHLGADRIVLWGTSYGSTLALAALKEIEDSIAKVVLSSVEGLNQAIKLPARTDECFDRLQDAINSQPEAKAVYPDIKGLMRRVHAKLADQRNAGDNRSVHGGKARSSKPRPGSGLKAAQQIFSSSDVESGMARSMTL